MTITTRMKIFVERYHKANVTTLPMLESNISIPTNEINKQEPIEKHTRNRNVNIPIISSENLQKYKEFAINSVNRDKTFLNLIYNDNGYMDYFYGEKILKSGKRKLLKRGNNSLNWKINGNFICPSLSKANKIYQAFGSYDARGKYK